MMKPDKNRTLLRLLSAAFAVSAVLSILLGILLYREKRLAEPAQPSLPAEALPGTAEWDAISVREEELQISGDYDPAFMTLAIQNAVNGISEGKGGPIGAVIVKDGKVISSASNENWISGYSFAHAEMCAMRDAMTVLGTKNLAGCQLYTSAQPCLMCESAIADAHIDKVYYAATLEDMLLYGYDDISEYEAIREGKNLVPSVAVMRSDRLKPLDFKKSLGSDAKNTSIDGGALHIDHQETDVYGSPEYLETPLLVTGNRLPQEKTFTLSELENLAVSEDGFLHSGDYSLMSGGGVFSRHSYTGIKVYEFLKYCGLQDDIPDDTAVTFVSVDGFSYAIPWGEIRNSRDNAYAQKGDKQPVSENLPKILAFASDGIPLVGPVGKTELAHRFTAEDGFSESAENAGGPVRLVFGQKSPEDSNAPKNLQWIRQIIVGEDDFRGTHEEMLKREQALRANSTVTVNENEGVWSHAEEPYSEYLSYTLKVYGPDAQAEMIYTLDEIEKMQDATVTDTYAASGGIYVFRGVRMRDLVFNNLKKTMSVPSRITIVSADGYETEISVDDVINGTDSRYQAGKHRDVILAYAVNGKPLVSGKEDRGFDGDNGTGPMQLVVENQISKWIKNVTAIRIGE